MKKLKYLLFVLLLIPVFVFAKDKDIEFRDIVLKNISPNTVILKDAEFEKDEFQLDLQMFEVGDFIEYQFTIDNYTNKDYKIKTNSFNKTINSVQYKILSNDNSYIVKSNSSKNFIIRVSYIDEVSSKDYSLNEYDASSKITLDIDKTGLSSLSFTEDDLDLTLVSNISIDSMTPHPCSSGLSLSQGTEYVNGQYTYRYRQQNNGGTSWTNISGFIYGWGVHLTNTASTDPVTTTLCTSIDNYPIISMAYMFAGSMASSIDLSSFNTSNVISMDRMFVNASNVTSLDFSTFNTHKVTNMSTMFTHCTSLLELDLSNFYTYKVTAMDSMFNSCTSLTNLDISNFNTSNVTTMSAMFFNCTNLTEINMSGFDFSQNSSICSVIGGLFSGTGSLKKINMSNWKLSADMSNSIFRCTGAYDSPIEEIDVTGWNLSKTTNVSGMFGSNGSAGTVLKTIKGLDTWDTSHLTSFNNLFGGLSSLEELDLSSFDTSQATNTSYMFYGMSSLKELNLSSFDMSNVTNSDDMFTDCTSVEGSYARTPEDAEILNAVVNKPDNVIFIIGRPEEKFHSDLVMKSVEFVELSGSTIENHEAYLKDNRIQLDVNMYDVDDSITYRFVVQNISDDIRIMDSNMINDDSPYIEYQIISEDNSFKFQPEEVKEFTLIATYKNGVEDDLFHGGKFSAAKTVLFDIKDNSIIPDIINPETGSFFFFIISLLIASFVCFKFTKKKKISVMVFSFLLLIIPFFTNAEEEVLLPGIDFNINIKYIHPNPCTYDGDLIQGAEFTNGQYTYRYMQNYVYDYVRQNINGSWQWITIDEWQDMESDGWGVRISDATSTDPVTTTLCTSINDKPITSMRAMFYNSQTTSIDTSSFDTSNVVSMHSMFRKAPNIESIDIQQFDMSELVDMRYMLYDAKSIESLDFSYLGGDKLSYFSSVIPSDGNAALKDVDFSYFNFGLVQGLTSGSLYGISVEHITFSHANMSHVTSTDTLFSYWSNLKTIDFSYVDLSNVTSMNSTFYRVESLESVDMSYAKIGSVQDISYLFADSPNLSSFTLTGISFENVTRAYYAFRNLPITSLDLSMFSTPKIENLNYFITSCSSLEEINISNWGSDVLSNANSIVAYCNSLKKITMDNFNFGIFQLYGFLYLDSNNNLEELSLRDATAINTMDCYRMFESMNFPKLKKLDMTGFIFGSDMRYFFSNTNGRTFMSAETLIFDDIDTSNVTNMYGMFYNTPLTSFDFSLLDTSGVSTMSYMFYGTNFSTLDLSHWNVSNLSDTKYMFSYSNASTIDLTGWIFSNNTNLSEIFSGARATEVILDDIVSFPYQSFLIGNSSIKKISAKNWVIPASFTHVFFRSSGGGETVEEIDVTGWDLSNASNIDGVFAGNDSRGSNLNSIIGLDTWDTSNITNMGGLFFQLPSLTSLDLSSFDTSNVTDISTMFLNCTGFTELDLSSFDLSNVTSSGSMFYGCTSLTTVYARTQADADILNATTYKPDNVHAIVKT